MSIVVVLRPGQSGNDVYLRRDRSTSIDVYLQSGAPAPNDVYLRPEGHPVDAIEPPAIVDATGTVAWTEDSDTAALAGTLTASGAPAWNEDDDITAIEATVSGATAEASIAWTEDDDGLVITAASDANLFRSVGGGRYVRPWRRRPDVPEIEDESRRRQRERERIAAKMAQAKAAEQAAQQAVNARLAELADRLAREQVSIRQRRLERQRIEAARLEAARVYENEMRALRQKEAELQLEIEELDVAFVAAVLLAA